MKGLLVWCDEHKLPIRYCIRQALALSQESKVGLADWSRYMQIVTGDKGCQVWFQKIGETSPKFCLRPAFFWTKTPWGCGCTKRVCRMHSRRRKIAENACTCQDHPPTVGRGRGGEPSPWQENAIRAMEGDEA